MNCPLCGTGLVQHLIQPELSIISCPSETCVYPFNLSVSELHAKNLIVTNVSTSDIMKGVHSKMVGAEVDSRIAAFITRDDKEIE
jgi:hypothetical protein